MAETFKVGANARELLRYTQRATRIVTDDISRSDARKIIQKVAALEDVRDIQKVCATSRRCAALPSMHSTHGTGRAFPKALSVCTVRASG